MEGIMHYLSKKTDENVSMHLIIFHHMEWFLLFLLLLYCFFSLFPDEMEQVFLNACHRPCRNLRMLQNHDHSLCILPVLSDLPLFALPSWREG